MDKKGFSHIEVILGFVLFITAVIFALVYMRVGYNPDRKISDTFYEDISGKLKEEVYEYSLKLNESSIKNKNQEIIAVLIEGQGNSSMFNYSGSNVSSQYKKDQGTLYFDRTGKGDRYDIFISKAIDNPRLIKKEEKVDLEYYKLSPPLVRQMVTENKLLEVNRSFYNEYELLKDNMGLKNDFGIYVTVGNREINMTKPNRRVDVFSKRETVEILKKDGNMTFSIMRIEVW